MRILIGITSVVFALTLAPTGMAQYSGPSAKAPQSSVAEVLKNPKDDKQVVLEGFITRQVGKDKYMFSDSTGEIRVEIERKHMPTTAFNDKTRVQIRGEVDKDFRQAPEIEVKSVVVLK